MTRTLSQEQESEIRQQFADVQFYRSTPLADYYTVGAARSITVSARNASGRYLCHTCVKNVCEHTERVREYEELFGTPGERALRENEEEGE